MILCWNAHVPTSLSNLDHMHIQKPSYDQFLIHIFFSHSKPIYTFSGTESSMRIWLCATLFTSFCHMGHGGWPHYVGYYQSIYVGEFFYSLNKYRINYNAFHLWKDHMGYVSNQLQLPIMHLESFSDMCWADSFENEGSTNRSKSKEKNCWSS